MSVRNGRQMARTRLVEQVFQEHGYARVEAYPYKLGAIRVRLVDDRFAGKPYFRRIEMVTPIIHEFSEEIQQAISFVVLVTPDELADPTMNHSAAMNRAFENRTPMGV